MNELEQLESRIRRAKTFDTALQRVLLAIFLVMALFFGSTMVDMFRFTYAGIETIEYHDFGELLSVNPATVAWIRLDNTNINHPVVQGKDNFEWLDKDFYGGDYAGGCIFLDAENSPDLSDRYIIIHGHHMARGAMFGDLGDYHDETFFRSNESGALLTPDARYELTVAGVATEDAYDGSIYYVSKDRERPDELLARCEQKRELTWNREDQLLALSTCAGDMSNKRTILFCRMRYIGKNI